MRRPERDPQEGSIAVLAGLFLLLLIGFLALSLNVGFAMVNRNQLQNGSDSAALGAAGDLDGTAGGLTAARQRAQIFAGQHQLTGALPISIQQGSDVMFGRWHFTAEGGWPARSFEPSSNAFLINAVKVVDGRDSSGNHNPPLEVMLGYFLGKSQITIGSTAIAIGPGARTGCPMPFVLPLCPFQAGGGYVCGTDITLTLSPAGTDSVGFIFFDGSSGTTGVVSNIVNRCNSTVDANEAQVQNGNNLNDQVLQAMLGVTSQGPNVTPIAPLLADGSSKLCVFNPDQDSFPMADVGCPPSFTGTATVARFTRVVLKQMVDNNGNIYGPGSCPKGTVRWNTVPTGSGGGGRSLTVNLPCDADGGLTTSASAAKLRLVQ